MNFQDGSLFPENQEKLVITCAPYGPEWMPSDFPEDIAVSIPEQVQKAVDCYNAGATVLHVHVREDDGKGSKRLSKFNELLAGLKQAVPDMILQVGGSISFAPEGEGATAKWLSDDTRHMLAELKPTPDQVTIAINSNQMNVVEQMCEADIAGTSLADPANYRAYREMTIPAGPEWVEEHIKRLSANGIQTHFQLANIAQLDAGRQIQVTRQDGFEGLKALLPPPNKRALVLIDPSYEIKQDYAKVITAVQDSLKRFSTGTYMVWYPVIPRPEAHDLPRRLKTMAVKEKRSWCHATLAIGADEEAAAPLVMGEPRRPGLRASGVFVINPPHTLQAALRQALPDVLATLGRGAGKGWTVDAGG